MINYDLFTKCDNRKTHCPAVSVIIVAYNTNVLLIDCLDSLQDQKTKDFEIILIDNGNNENVVDKINRISYSLHKNTA